MILFAMEPILIGYFPKQTMLQPDFLKSAGVEEISSAATCLSKEPDGWIDRWLHNEMWLFDTPALAWIVVPEIERATFHLYAYEMFPVKFTKQGQEPFTPSSLGVEPLSSSFKLLGYDAVSRSYDNKFECSPLSCCHFAGKIPVNSCCLFADAETALRYAAKFGIEEPEPGPYYVVSVWRQQQH